MPDVCGSNQIAMQRKIKSILIAAMALIVSACSDDLPENYGNVQPILFLGDGDRQPLVVGLGGSEGGNAWATERWKPTRDKFVKAGYAFLALGYFGAAGTPEQLDRIAIESVHQAILNAAKNPKVDGNRIALVGGSKGAELALVLASYFKDIDCVVAMVPGNCAFPALTMGASTSSWSYNGKEIPFVPAPWAAVPSIISRDLRKAFEIMREDKSAVEKALIKVENINGPILLISAKKDEMWPSTEMSSEMMARLRDKKFRYPYEHWIDQGGHMEVLDYFDNVLSFLDKNFPAS
jgi:dienelactone hydrolase